MVVAVRAEAVITAQNKLKPGLAAAARELSRFQAMQTKATAAFSSTAARMGAAAHQRMAGSVMLALKAMDAGCQMVRVHDMAETVQAFHVWRGLRDAALTDFSQLV